MPVSNRQEVRILICILGGKIIQENPLRKTFLKKHRLVLKGKGGFSIDSDGNCLSVFRELKAFAKNALKYHSHCIMKQCDAMVEAASSYCSLEAKIMKKRGRNLNYLCNFNIHNRL